MYTKTLLAGWADMDFNGHMKNTAFLDKSADVRMMFFSDHGFPAAEFSRLKLGPVIMRDELEYHREVNLLQPLTVSLALAGLSDDGSRFLIRNEVSLAADGRLCGRVTSTGGWLDLSTRRLSTPPDALLAAIRSLDPTPDFVSLPSSLKPRA